jgi:hypothetical protein
MKAVEVVIPENGVRFKGIRDGESLRIHLSQKGVQLGNCDFARRIDGMWEEKRNRMKVGREDVQSCLTVYCSLMALMAYGRPIINQEPETKETQPHKAGNRRHSQNKTNTTYIIRSLNGVLTALPRGSHASPKGVFSVRGHYRHYKNGKTVWIAQYQKGTGRKKPKTYKIGGAL